jgi:hypothetical protein
MGSSKGRHNIPMGHAPLLLTKFAAQRLENASQDGRSSTLRETIRTERRGQGLYLVIEYFSCQ